MNTTTNTRRATGKATREHVLRLARNLPLAKSVLASRVETATPGQLAFLADLFRAENESRERSRRERPARQAAFPQPKDLCFASMSFQQAHQYFSAVWADGFPRSRHHAVSDVR